MELFKKFVKCYFVCLCKTKYQKIYNTQKLIEWCQKKTIKKENPDLMREKNNTDNLLD
jgi:hypothetical protein